MTAKEIFFLIFFLFSSFHVCILCFEESNNYGMVFLLGGRFRLGSNDSLASSEEKMNFERGEITVESFWLDETEVTNEQFREFIKKTKYNTQAQGPLPLYGWSFVLDYFVSEKERKKPTTKALAEEPHWLSIQGASWYFFFENKKINF